MRIIAYLRVSTDMQSNGIDGQRKSCQEFVKKIGTEIAEEFVDINYSGALSFRKRPALSEALSKLQKGDILLVYKRDRLARGIDTMMEIDSVVRERKSSIISTCGEGTDKEDAQSRLFRNMSDSFALYEKEIICERITNSMQTMKNAGRLVGRVPFGCKLKSDGKYLEELEDEQIVLREMKSLHEKGLSIRKIAKELNSKNLFNRGRSPWNHSSLFRILNRQHLPVLHNSRD